MIELIFRLLIAHAVCDFALQSCWMIQRKQRGNLTGKWLEAQMPSKIDFSPHWSVVLTAHCLICGAGVWWATGVMWIGLVEIISHWLIDFAKCEGWSNPNDDQAAHICCRVFYLIWMI